MNLDRHNNRRTAALIFSVLAVLLGIHPVSAQTHDLERIEGVADSIAHAEIINGRTPGMSVAVARDGEILFTRGYGKVDVEMGVAAGPETVYRIGSITKQFTAAIIMRFVEAGKIALDDAVTKYLPEYPAQGHQVTVRHLLNHTSGMGSGSYDTPDERKAARRRSRLDLSNDELLELFAKAPFESEPGEDFEYSNKNYMLLGMIVSKITGMPYAEYIERKLLQPLGLDHSLYCDVRRVIPNRAEGYGYNDSELVNAPFISMQTPGAAGAICSTVGDLLRWTHLLHGGKVISPASLRQMRAPTVEATGGTASYGFGLRLGELEDHPMIYHGGSISGFQSVLAFYPEDGLSIAVLMNSNTGVPERVEEALARAALGIELHDLPLTAEDISRYEGTYALQADDGTFNLRVFPEDGRLNAELVGEFSTPLLYQGDDVFIAVADHDMRLVFAAADGRAERVTFHMGRLAFSGERAP